MMADVSMKGLPQLLRKLEGLSYDAKKKGGRFALRKAAQVIRDRVKDNAMRLDDKETGRSIVSNVAERWDSRYNKATGNLKFRVGILGGAKLPKEEGDKSAGSATPHWRLLEFGTEKMAARPFMRPAGSESAQQATDVFITEFSKAIDRAIKRAKK